ncbi:hypothetical protein NMY22_g11469 [Coprinellus aureogranulatus]|nr:hypothetical protein NMY22_g11469 [Coprinellus aureogranulatus]
MWYTRLTHSLQCAMALDMWTTGEKESQKQSPRIQDEIEALFDRVKKLETRPKLVKIQRNILAAATECMKARHFSAQTGDDSGVVDGDLLD